MPHRDPETGQFVEGQGEDHREHRYNNLEKQHINVRSGITSNNADNLAQDQFRDGDTEGPLKAAWTVSDISHEPANGLDRGELAELVSVEMFINFHPNFTEGLPKANQEQPGYWQALTELSLSPPFVHREDRGEVETYDENQTPGDPWNIGVRSGSNEASDLLIHDQSAISLGVNQDFELVDTDPSGPQKAAGDAYHTQKEINYRLQYGEGPMVDRFDDLFIGHAINSINAIDPFRFEAFFSLTWDVFEDADQRSPLGSRA